MTHRRRFAGCARLASGLLLVLAVSASAADLAADFADRWRWVHFTVDSGLPSNDVTDLIETVDGTPWVATGGGLAWYDGHRWQAVGERQGLPGQSIKSLSARPQGGVAVVVGGAAYAGDSSGFRRVLTPPGTVRSIACLDTGAFLARIGSDIFRIERDGMHERLQLGDRDEPADRVFSSLPGRALVSTATGLLLFDGSRWSTVVDYGAWVNIHQALDIGGGDVLFTVLQPYTEQGAWRRRSNGDLRSVDLRSAERVVEAAARPDGTVVLAYESGAVGLADSAGSWRSVALPPAIGGVSTLAFREDGDLWAGTSRGLWLFRASSGRWSIPAHSPDADANVVHALLRARDGRLWVGTRAGLEIRDADGNVEDVRRISDRPIPVVTALAEDAEGAIWVGSGSGFEGAWRWKDGDWRHFGEREGLLAPHVHAVRIDQRGRPWFLGLSRNAIRGGPGAFVLEAGEFRGVSPPGDEDSQRIYDLAEGPVGTFWFATQGGLHRLSDGRWRSWVGGEAVSIDRVFTLELTPENRPSFSSDLRGICFMPDDETIDCDGTADGLPNDVVMDLAFDESGALWASTQGGLAVRRGGQWSAVLPHHGLPLLRLWPLLVERDHVLMGTTGRGLAQLRLTEVDLPPPRVTYRELDLARGTTRVEWNADAWWGTQAEGEVESRWRLSGGEWSNWSRKRELLFEDLAVGEHHLEIEAKALLGQRAPPTRLDFEVLAPLHARPEVLVPTALVLVTAAGWLGFGAWRRRSFAREIARREQRFSEILDNVDDVIFTANLDGRLTSLNRAGMELAAHAATDAAAIDWETLLNPASRDRAAEALRQKQADGRSAAYEIEFSGADGRAHVLEVHSRLVRSQGRPPEIQGVARDVTERRRLESQLHHAQKMESLGLLAGGVAHDFNNLLLSILGNLDLARGAWRDGRSPSQALDDLEIAAERGTDLARVMLAYSGRARFEIRPLDFTELTGEILRLLRASLPSTVRFDTDLPDSLPAIEGDRAQIQQVILNLVTNAADAIGDEDGTISVRTGAGAAAECRLGQPALDADFGDGSVSWLQVTDSGPGIDATTLERIFDPFFTTKGAGRGLGLSAVLGIVRSHGGALDVRSTPGRGTSFRMLFPALTGPAPPEPQVEPARRKGLSGSRVLVVDDEDRVREMVGRLLKRSGCEVLTARDGLEAQGVVRAEAGRLDAVLLDLVMPRCSGEQALVAIREMAPDLPVVLTSGFTEQEVSARHVGRGPTSFLGKPYRLADLEAAFSAAFGALERSEPEDGSDGSQ